MPPDTIQIGPFVISRIVLDVLAPLVGTVIGGLLTYFSTRAVENRKWEQQKKDKMHEQRREAIALALEWIEPIDAALTKAALVVSSFLHNNISEDELKAKWPSLLSTLSSKDIPARLRILLPSQTYARGLMIVQGLENLRAFTLRSQPHSQDDWIVQFRKCADEVEKLQSVLASLSEDLTEEYKSTFR